ncbi:MAG TPA: ABC transporter permease [Candidatus Limnocylindria bacterium]|nr:ABC transporter permease [Candidatus Limnocylindria bacterium]
MIAGADSKPGPTASPRARPSRAPDPRRATFLVLSLPAVAALAALIVLPLLFMVALSVRPDLRGDLLAPFAPTLKHFEQVADTFSYWRLLGISAGMAAIVAAVATAAAFPIAYFLAFRAGRRAALYLILLLVPFWTSYLLRVMAWKLMLGTEGVINEALLAVGLVGEPLDALLYNRNAVVITLVYVWIPFAALPILAALGRIDVRLHDAAADLYATPWQQFRRVTLPLALPGLAAAFLMVFIPTVGEYVTPLLVGGTGGSMYGNIIQDFFVRAANWPLGSALSVIMLAVTLVLVVVGLRVVQPRRLLGV